MTFFNPLTSISRPNPLFPVSLECWDVRDIWIRCTALYLLGRGDLILILGQVQVVLELRHMYAQAYKRKKCQNETLVRTCLIGKLVLWMHKTGGVSPTTHRDSTPSLMLLTFLIQKFDEDIMLYHDMSTTQVSHKYNTYTLVEVGQPVPPWSILFSPWHKRLLECSV